MIAVHILCRRGLNVRPDPHPEYECGNWDFALSDAERLVGGMLFFHNSKGERSYFGGRVLSYRLVTVPEKGHSARIVFRVRSLREGKEVRWRGANHGMAWSGGLIEVPDPAVTG